MKKKLEVEIPDAALATAIMDALTERGERGKPIALYKEGKIVHVMDNTLELVDALAYRRIMDVIDLLMECDPKPDTPMGILLNGCAMTIEAYEHHLQCLDDAAGTGERNG